MQKSKDELSLADRGLQTLPLKYLENVNTTTLKLYKNKLSSLPKETAKLSRLVELDISSNLFKEIPEVVCNFTRLRVLDVSENTLVTLPPFFGQLQSLKTLNLANNQFVEIPACVCELQNLAELDMSDNDVRVINPDIGKLQKLTTVALDNNQIKQLPAELFSLKLLSVLHVEANTLNDVHPTIGSLTNLVDLDLGDNCLETLPDMERLKKLRNLTLDDNEFSVLPASVTKLASLKVLSLKGNKLKDLPAEIAQLTNLKELNIGSNKITAKVLLKLMNMTSLCQLNIGDNAIRYLPFEVLSRLGQLKKIYMQDNPVKYPPLEVCLLGVEEMKKYQKANPIPDILTRLESEDEDYTLYEETVFLFGNDKEEQKLVFLNNITLTVPPGVVKENVEVKASLEGGEIFRPKLKENEAFESEIIDLQPRLMNFKKPALLEIPIGIDNSRNIMVLSSDDGIRWSTHLTNKGKNGVSIKITKLAMFAVVSSQVQEDFDMEPQGCTFKSTVCKDVTITFPAGAVGTKDKLSVQIMQVSRDAVSASFEENSGLENEMSFSPVVCVTSGRKQGSFKKSVVLSLPRPPKLPSGKSDIRIVADKSDTDDWQDVTEEVKPSVSGNVVTCVVPSFSKYGAVNSSQRERGRVARHATKVYNNAKRGINKAKILLLQRIQNPKQMVVSVLEAKKLSEHIERFEGMGYGSYRQSGIPYSRDILLRRRKRISFEVSDGFEIYLGMKQLVFYPNQECFSEVNLRSLKSANDNILEGSLKFFMKKSPDTGRKPGESESGQIAELLFVLGKYEVLQAHIVTQAKQVPKKLKRSISYVTSTLTKSGKDWKSFGEKLGMSVDELEAIEAENSEERDCVHQLFLRWLDKEQDGATNERIIETLRKEGYLGMAEIVQKLLNKDALQSAIEIVAELLPPKEWKQFGRSKKGLNLSTQDIEHIDTDYQQDGIREKKYQMLLLWQNRKGPAATVSKLVDSLDKCELKELADKLRNECRE